MRRTETVGDLEFLKKVEEEIKTEQEEQKQEENSDVQSGWIDTANIMEELKKAAEEILYEKDPKLKDKVEELKNKYKDVYVYFFDDEEFYIYRPLTRFEYKDITSKTDKQDEITEMIVLKATLYPELTEERLDGLKAGIVPTLLELILNASNFGVQNPVVKL
jgi:hypothetical protein